MIAFPKIEHLSIQDYQLYPGDEDHPGLEIDFDSGPWLVLGVNGLGKSTLLLLMRYLIVGSVRLRPAGFSGQRKDMTQAFKKLFAVRVQDLAVNAKATIRISVGDKSVSVTRQLADLKYLDSIIADSKNTEQFKDEEQFQHKLTQLIGVNQFEDTVRIVDYLMFVMENQESLIWNLEAQFEIFRGLFVPNLSQSLRELEGQIISSDSAARNLNAALYKVVKDRDKKISNAKNANATRAKLETARASIEADETRIEGILNELEELQSERDNSRLQLKRSEKQFQDASSKYDKLKLDSIRQAFANVDETFQYIYLKLFSDSICIVCNNNAEDLANEIEARNENGQCAVCGSKRNPPKDTVDFNKSWRNKVKSAHKTMKKTEAEMLSHRQNFANFSMDIRSLENQQAVCRNNVEKQSANVRRLTKQLPKDDKARLREEEARIAALRGQVEEFRQQRADFETKISSLIEQLSEAVEKVRLSIEEKFNSIAKPFFAENVQLVYSPRQSSIGQGGRKFDFPAFEVEMTSGATLGEFVRRSDSQVSLSQRLYLDIIFRMALMSVLGNKESTIVVDGPEGSLDAIFAERAGSLFSDFAKVKNSNVILACNIVEGGLIPFTLKGYTKNQKRDRIVNLIEKATPTAALAKLKLEYREKLEEILDIK